MSTNYTLYGAELSLYTGKIRAYLCYKNIPFNEVMSTKKVYEEIIVPKTGVRFIPVLKTPEDKYIQDTAVMMDELESTFEERSIKPTGPKQAFVSAMFEMWGDEWLLLPAMHYRWNKDNFPFIYEEFGSFVAPNMPAFIRRFIGKKVGAKFRGFVPLLGIIPETEKAIEDWYENHVLVLLDAHFAEHDYLLGERASVGDFGLMGPLYAHLYRDPAPGKIMQDKAPNLSRWVERMNTTPINLGDWLENDEIPETLLPLIERQLKEFWPVALDVKDKVQAWLEANPNTSELPRSVGEQRFFIGDTYGVKAAASFTQWKLQRVLDVYTQSGLDAQSEIETFLSRFSGGDFINEGIEHPLRRVENKLIR